MLLLHVSGRALQPPQGGNEARAVPLTQNIIVDIMPRWQSSDSAHYETFAISPRRTGATRSWHEAVFVQSHAGKPPHAAGGKILAKQSHAQSQRTS